MVNTIIQNQVKARENPQVDDLSGSEKQNEFFKNYEMKSNPPVNELLDVVDIKEKT